LIHGRSQGWFYRFNGSTPLEIMTKKLIMYVVKNAVNYAPKCIISKKKFQKFYKYPLVAFGHVCGLWPLVVHSLPMLTPNEIPG